MIWKSNKQRLKERKEFQLFEIRQDIKFIEDYHGDFLTMNEKQLRKDYVEVKTRWNENKNENDELAMRAIEKKIARIVAVTKELEDLRRVEKELTYYISIL